MPGSSAEHGISAKGSSSSQLKSWLSGLGKKGKAEVEEVRALLGPYALSQTRGMEQPL